jgi:predicted lipid-binding transport protein (Tim44 family)
MNFAYLDILFFAIIAGFLFVRLWDVLGSKHGSERQRPAPDLNPESSSHARRSDNPATNSDQPDTSIDITIGNHDDIARNLTTIEKALPGFTPDHFLKGARTAFEMIVKAFANGNITTLESFVNPEIMDTFEDAIRDRNKKGHHLHTEIVAMKKIAITDASVKNDRAHITVLFHVEESRYTKDKDGNIVHGDPEQIYTARNLWTFTKTFDHSDPNWVLIATRFDNNDEGS